MGNVNGVPTTIKAIDDKNLASAPSSWKLDLRKRVRDIRFLKIPVTLNASGAGQGATVPPPGMGLLAIALNNIAPAAFPPPFGPLGVVQPVIGSPAPTQAQIDKTMETANIIQTALDDLCCILELSMTLTSLELIYTDLGIPKLTRDKESLILRALGRLRGSEYIQIVGASEALREYLTKAMKISKKTRA